MPVTISAWRPRWSRAAFAALALALPGAAAADSPAPLGPQGWQRLLFEAGGARAEIRLDAAVAEAPAALATPAPGRTPLPARDAPLAKLTASFGAERSDNVYRTEIWYRPETAEVLMRRRDKLGSGGSRKTFRFFAEGVERVRRDPSWWRGESDLPPERWSEVKETFYPYGAAGEDCPLVTDPGLLLLAVAAGRVPDDGTPLALCVFNKQALYRTELRATGTAPHAVDYRLTADGDEERVAGEIAARRILLTARPFDDSPKEPEAFEFFELRGDIEFLVDPVRRLPVRIAGEIAALGRVALELTEAAPAP